jgi:hypothetical protein
MWSGSANRVAATDGPMSAPTFTHENVIATWPDVSDVYHAVMALEFAGIDGSDIRVFGEGAERAELLAEADVAAVDVQAFRRLVPRLAVGALLGAVAGAGLGLLAVLLLDHESSATAVAAIFGLVVLCGGVGGLVGLFTRLGTGPAWDLSLVPTHGSVSIVVSSTDPHVLDRAEEVLRRFGTATVSRLDDRARPV